MYYYVDMSMAFGIDTDEDWGWHGMIDYKRHHGVGGGD